MIKRWLVKHKGRAHSVNADHIETLSALHHEAFFQGWSMEDFAGLLQQKTTRAWCLSLNWSIAGKALGKRLSRGSIKAALVCSIIGDEAEILSLFTAKGWQNKGAAQKLLALGRDELIREGARRWVLEVDEHNQAACHLYRSFGFEQVGHRPAYYQNASPTQTPHNALILARSLP